MAQPRNSDRSKGEAGFSGIAAIQRDVRLLSTAVRKLERLREVDIAELAQDRAEREKDRAALALAVDSWRADMRDVRDLMQVRTGEFLFEVRGLAAKLAGYQTEIAGVKNETKETHEIVSRVADQQQAFGELLAMVAARLPDEPKKPNGEGAA